MYLQSYIYKNIPASFDFITTLNQGVFLCSPCILYGRETLSLALRDDLRLKMLQNRVLRRIFVPKRDEITGEWRKLHNEELNDLYCSLNLIRVIKFRRLR
jgi:hypothetical protein